MIPAFILIILIIAGLEIPGLVKNKMWRELITYSGLMLTGVVLAILQMTDIPLPNPNDLVEAIYKPLVQWMMDK